MCPTYCHRRGVVYDSDYPCAAHCPPPLREHPTGVSCGDCRHLHPREGRRALCTLTGQPIPFRGWCCHWNITPTPGDHLLTLDTADATWQPIGTTRAFDLAELVDAGEVLRVSDLARPDMYGVAASAWYEGCHARPAPHDPEATWYAIVQRLHSLLEAELPTVDPALCLPLISLMAAFHEVGICEAPPALSEEARMVAALTLPTGRHLLVEQGLTQLARASRQLVWQPRHLSALRPLLAHLGKLLGEPLPTFFLAPPALTLSEGTA